MDSSKEDKINSLDKNKTNDNKNLTNSWVVRFDDTKKTMYYDNREKKSTQLTFPNNGLVHLDPDVSNMYMKQYTQKMLTEAKKANSYPYVGILDVGENFNLKYEVSNFNEIDLSLGHVVEDKKIVFLNVLPLDENSWVVLLDEKNKTMYYYNRKTRSTQWTFPDNGPVHLAPEVSKLYMTTNEQKMLTEAKEANSYPYIGILNVGENFELKYKVSNLNDNEHSSGHVVDDKVSNLNDNEHSSGHVVNDKKIEFLNVRPLDENRKTQIKQNDLVNRQKNQIQELSKHIKQLYDFGMEEGSEIQKMIEDEISAQVSPVAVREYYRQITKSNDKLKYLTSKKINNTWKVKLENNPEVVASATKLNIIQNVKDLILTKNQKIEAEEKKYNFAKSYNTALQELQTEKVNELEKTQTHLEGQKQVLLENNKLLTAENSSLKERIKTEQAQLSEIEEINTKQNEAAKTEIEGHLKKIADLKAEIARCASEASKCNVIKKKQDEQIASYKLLRRTQEEKHEKNLQICRENARLKEQEIRENFTKITNEKIDEYNSNISAANAAKDAALKANAEHVKKISCLESTLSSTTKQNSEFGKRHSQHKEIIELRDKSVEDLNKQLEEITGKAKSQCDKELEILKQNLDTSISTLEAAHNDKIREMEEKNKAATASHQKAIADMEEKYEAGFKEKKTAIEKEVKQIKANFKIEIEAKQKEIKSCRDAKNRLKEETNKKLNNLESKVKEYEIKVKSRFDGLDKEFKSSTSLSQDELTKQLNEEKVKIAAEISKSYEKKEINLNLQITNLNENLEKTKAELDKIITEQEKKIREISFESLSESIKNRITQLQSEKNNSEKKLNECTIKSSSQTSEIKTLKNKVSTCESKLRAYTTGAQDFESFLINRKNKRKTQSLKNQLAGMQIISVQQQMQIEELLALAKKATRRLQKR